MAIFNLIIQKINHTTDDNDYQPSCRCASFSHTDASNIDSSPATFQQQILLIINIQSTKTKIRLQSKLQLKSKFWYKLKSQFQRNQVPKNSNQDQELNQNLSQKQKTNKKSIWILINITSNSHLPANCSTINSEHQNSTTSIAVSVIKLTVAETKYSQSLSKSQAKCQSKSEPLFKSRRTSVRLRRTKTMPPRLMDLSPAAESNDTGDIHWKHHSILFATEAKCEHYLIQVLCRNYHKIPHNVPCSTQLAVTFLMVMLFY